MRKAIQLLVFAILLYFLPSPGRAQSAMSATGTITTTNATACTTVTTYCVIYFVGNNAGQLGGATITISGNSGAGTLNFAASADGVHTNAIGATPFAGGSQVTSTTATSGTWTVSMSAVNGWVEVYASALPSGTPSVTIEAGNPSAKANSGGGGPPSGSAGGDLSGTYPNPTVAQVNGATVPASSTYVGTNSSKQIVTAATPVTSVGGIANQTACTGSTSVTCGLATAITLPGSLTAGTGASITVSGTGTNNATALNGTAFAGTSTHLTAFGAANIPVDSGIVDTASGFSTLLQGLTGCNTATYVYTPQGSDCVAPGSGGGLSGMTAGQVPIAATATTVTSSEALAGSGAGITTGPVSGVTSGHIVDFTGTGGQIADGGAVAANLVVASSPGAGVAHFAGSTQTVTSSAVNLAADVSGQLPIGAVGSAGLSGTSPVTINSAGAIGCGTCGTGPGAATSHGLASWNGTGGLALESLNTQFTLSSTNLTAGSTGVLDMSAASATAGLKIPSAAGAVPTADGFIATNTTNHTHVWGSNGTTMVGAIAATGTGTATTCTNQAVTAVSSLAVPTCTTVTSAYVDSSVAKSPFQPIFGSKTASNSTAIGSAVAQNATYLANFTVDYWFSGSVSNIYYDITTTDNSANVYDIGVYGPNCNASSTSVPLIFHTGPVAGSSIATTTGSHHIGVSGAPVSFTAGPGVYCVAITSSAASPTLVMGGGNGLYEISYGTTAAAGGTGTTSSGTLNSTITAPATSISSNNTIWLIAY